MKVKELIEMLQELDQDSDIHLIYDCCHELDIDIERVEPDDVVTDKCKVGDYVIKAW